MMAYEKALEWRELFELAVLEEMPEDDLADLGYRVAGMSRFYQPAHAQVGLMLTTAVEDLSSKKRYTEAGRVLLDYSKDVREAIIALVSGNAFSEARRIVCTIFN